MFNIAKWIWPTSKFAKNQRAAFCFEADVASVPDSAALLIGCETKYWLFINDRLVVFDGGLFRESLPGCGYFDSVDIAEHLRPGRNKIAKIRKPATKFIKEPATRMINRFHQAAFWKDLGLSVSVSSPSIAQ